MGSNAFTIGPDGTFWIADAVGKRLLHYDPKGNALGTVSLANRAIGVGDLEVTASGILVLDAAAVTPTVLRLSFDATLLAVYEVPSDFQIGLSGIAIGDRGEVLVEQEGGAFVSCLVDSNGETAAKPLDGYVHHGRQYTARPAHFAAADKTRGYITAGDTRIDVSVTHSLAGLRLLGFNADDTFYVVVEELASGPCLQIDQTVRHYNVSGELVGIARVPIAEQYVNVVHGIALAPDGAVYTIVTRPDRVEVQQLRFFRELAPILAPPIQMNAGVGKIPVKELARAEEIRAIRPLSCVSRDSMMSTASTYYNNSKYLNATNTDGACDGRTKPSYIGGAGTYSSVPYDCDGSDTVSAYNT